MKKALLTFATVAMTAAASVAVLAGCAGGETATVTDVYHSNTHVSLQPWSSYDATVAQTNVITLYSDGNYVLDISICEGVAKPAEYYTSSLNIIGITMFGTYEKTYDEYTDTTTLSLSAATRILYTGTSSGATIATYGVLDTDDPESVAAFEASFWGGAEGLKAAVGGAKTVEVNDTNKTIVTDFYKYVSAMFPTNWD